MKKVLEALQSEHLARLAFVGVSIVTLGWHVGVV